MKRLLITLIFFLMLICGCSIQPSSNSANPAASEPTSPDDNSLQRYLSQTTEYVEPVCEEWENGAIIFEDRDVFENTMLLKIQKDGCEKEILDNITAWTPFSEHNILVTNDDFQIVKVNTQTGEMETMYQFDHRIKGINTNGVLIFWYTETEVYRYYIPEKQLDLIATDETIYAMSPPLSTTDICWQSYSPIMAQKIL